MIRLDLSTLDDLPAAVDTRRYDPRTVGIVHPGIGAFQMRDPALTNAFFLWASR